MECGGYAAALQMRPSSTAWLAATTHLVAAAAMLFLLREGLPGFPDEQRIAFMTAHRAAWTVGWLLWQLAAISLMAFYAALAMRIGGVLSIAAMSAAAAALSIDIASEARYIGVLPDLRGAEFAALDRELEVLIGYAANGLYTVALLLLVIAGWRVFPMLARMLSLPVIVSGFALAVASLQHDARLEIITSAILFPLLTLWIVVVGAWLRKSES